MTLLPNQKESLELFTPRFILFGLLMIALAREKLEDELTSFVRLKAMGFTFILVIGIVIIKPIADWIWKDPLPDPTSVHFVLRMLIAYHVIFFILKKFR